MKNFRLLMMPDKTARVALSILDGSDCVKLELGSGWGGNPKIFDIAAQRKHEPPLCLMNSC